MPAGGGEIERPTSNKCDCYCQAGCAKPGESEIRTGVTARKPVENHAQDHGAEHHAIYSHLQTASAAVSQGQKSKEEAHAHERIFPATCADSEITRLAEQ